MGESCIRGNVSHGDGVYRSSDAGRTWQHLGLERTRNIAKVGVPPNAPAVVYLAAVRPRGAPPPAPPPPPGRARPPGPAGRRAPSRVSAAAPGARAAETAA